jgi:outer membrane lipoprotein-sorting protein
MMKKLTALFFALACSLGAFSQSSHEQAKALLAAASEKMKTYSDVSLSFDNVIENNQVSPPLREVDKGFIKMKGEKYRLSAFGIEQIYDGNDIYVILPDDEEVTITRPSDDDDSEAFNPIAILDMYKRGFSLKLGGEIEVSGKTIVYVILKPNASERLRAITVGIEKSNNHLYSYEQIGLDGTITKFEVTSYRPNTGLPESTFKFIEAQYPDYYINDFRD